MTMRAYQAWKKNVESLLPARVVCPDCDGTGEGECPHCGNLTDCETCDGDKTIRPSEIITPEFYRRVMMFEQHKLERWAKGDPIITKDEIGRLVENHNPLSELIREFQPSPLSKAPLIALYIPVNSRTGSDQKTL